MKLRRCLHCLLVLSLHQFAKIPLEESCFLLLFLLQKHILMRSDSLATCHMKRYCLAIHLMSPLFRHLTSDAIRLRVTSAQLLTITFPHSAGEQMPASAGLPALWLLTSKKGNAEDETGCTPRCSTDNKQILRRQFHSNP